MRSRCDREIYCGSHVPPPEEVGCDGVGLATRDRLVELLSADQGVGLTPKRDLATGGVHPAVPDGSVFLWGEPSEEARLNAAGDSGQDGAHGGARTSFSDTAQIGRVLEERGGHTH